MAEDIKNILTHLNKDTNQETLIKYLNEQLGREEAHEVEENLVDDPFERDAVEGLQTVKDKEGLILVVEGLNRELRKKTARKRTALEKRSIKPQWLLYFSILILLIILVLIYIYIKKNLHS